MSTELTPGVVVLGEVVGHQPWGLELRVHANDEDFIGIVDVIYVTDDRPIQPPDDYPALGRMLYAVVLGYAPNGQLRLSTRDSDVDPLRDQAPGEP